MSENCSEYIEQIVYLLDNELDEGDIAVVRAHLSGCAPCNDSYTVQLTMKTLVARSCAERAPEGLRERIMVAMSKIQCGSED